MSVFLLAMAPSVFGQPTAVSSAERFFKDSGYSYKKDADEPSIFVVEREGRQFYFMAADGLFMGLTHLALKGNFKTSSEALTKFLQKSNEYNFVKVVLTDGGDLNLRFDIDCRLLDQKEFNQQLNLLFASEKEFRLSAGSFLTP